MDEAVSAIVSSGIPGALLVVLGYAYWKKEQDFKATQEARVADAQKFAKDSLEREDKWVGVLTDLTNELERANAGRTR